MVLVKDKICWKCFKRVWFWQRKGEPLIITDVNGFDIEILSHYNCKSKC